MYGLAGGRPRLDAMVGEPRLGETAMMLGSRRDVPDVLEAFDVAAVYVRADRGTRKHSPEAIAELLADPGAEAR